MRILVVLTYYHPHWTGLTAHAQGVAEGLASRGHQVTVLTAQYQPSLPRRDRHNGVAIVRLPVAGRVSRGVLMPGFPQALWQLAGENDVVHMHTPMAESLLLPWVARARGRRTVVTHHGDLIMPQGLGNQFVQRSGWAMMHLAFRSCAAVTSYSQDYAENSTFLRPFLPKTSFILPPVEIPAPLPEQVAAMRAELGLEGAPLIGFAGRFVEEKGFDFLLQAVPLIAEQFPLVRLVYAGEPNVAYEDFFGRCRALVERCADRLVFMGLLTDRQRLANYYAMCDAFALPSRTDCLAIVQVEAMLCGTPVVAADIPGARVAVRATGMGRLVRAQDPQALAQGLIEVLRAPEQYRRPQEQIRRVFDTEQTIAQYEQVLERLARQGRAVRG